MGDMSSMFPRSWWLIPPTLPFVGLLRMKPLIQEVQKLNPEPTAAKDIAELFGALVGMSVRFQATLPRDMVYGLLGIVPGMHAYIQPSYGPQKQDSDVFRELTQYLVKTSNNIDALFNWKRAEGTRLYAPSWIIDCTPVHNNEKWPTPMPFTRRYKADGGFGAWLRLAGPEDSKGSSSLVRRVSPILERLGLLSRNQPNITHQPDEYGPDLTFSSDGNTLFLHGLVFDTVNSVSASNVRLTEVEGISDPTPPTWLAGVCRELIKEFRWRHEVLKWKEFLEANLKAASDPYLDAGSSATREFWRAIIADSIRHPSGEFVRPDGKFIENVPQFFVGDTRPHTWGWGQPISEKAFPLYQIFGAEFCRAAYSRSLILTTKGFIGLAPQGTKPGDVISILKGYHMPVILRPVGGQQGTYCLVGNIYVHGIMDGSFCYDAKREDVKLLQIK
ncbi:hypothetical protein B0I35DRAFT_179912 [Stachybotrys elegans]|uniref:Heterokaryon incompatibility domain-containing protein n=1 Tax=Stachybotrys elegans TaxID=80388 RepID=A0A8K0SFY3_9HYPO|nr:hypothetical protein B0I35DRAFT_179912 [Stachybotrys elegans]